MALFKILFTLLILFGNDFVHGSRDRSGSDRRSSDRPNLYYYNRYQPLKPYPSKYYPGEYRSQPEAYKYNAKEGQRVYSR